VLGILLGLASSVSWGISDFLGGVQSRRVPAITVLLVSQPVGLVLALIVAVGFGGDALDGGDIALAVAAGIAVSAALAAFYRAMAIGSVSVVAMIGALGVLVPVIGGLLQGDEPGALQAVGAVIAISGVVLVAREPGGDWRSANRTSLLLAVFSAFGFGAFFLFLGLGSHPDPAWTIVVARLTSVAMLCLAALVTRPSLAVPRDMYPALLAMGVFDVSANSLFAIATNHGLLSLVGVASSLYSAVTVLLAWFVLGERLDRTRLGGVFIAVAGVGLIAAGA
jgi:drug/metabolite transporter (DMT)-like permease